MDSRLRQHVLGIVLVAFIGLAVSYSFVIPLGEAPDEVSHWAYVQYLLAHHSLPTPEGPARGDSAQPPFYYFVGAAATFWIPQPDFQPIANPDFRFDNPETPNLLLHTRREALPYEGVPLAWHLFRLLSVVMGTVTVWATAKLAAEFVVDEKWLATASAAFVAFLPGYASLSAVVNNDNLVILLSTLAVLQAVRMGRHSPRGRDSALLGLTLGLAAVTKLSGLVAWFFAAGIFAIAGWHSRRWTSWIGHAAICFGIGLVVVAPLFAYNWTHYGDPLGWALTMQTTPIRTAPMTLEDWRGLLAGLFTSFWGRFGGALHLRMDDIVYLLLGAFGVIPFVGWAIYAGGAREDSSLGDPNPVLAALALYWVVLGASFFRWTLAELGTDQARQLFPGLPLLALFLTLGLSFFFPAHRKVGVAAAYGGMFLLNVAVIAYLALTFAGSPLSQPLRPSSAAARPADFGGQVRVASFQIEDNQVAPGDAVLVRVDWQALRNIDRDYWLLLQLTDSRGVVANQDGVPDAGRRTTDWWTAGQDFSSHQRLVVPADLSEGQYTLQMGLHPYGTWDWLPVNGHDMLVLGTVQVKPIAR